METPEQEKIRIAELVQVTRGMMPKLERILAEEKSEDILEMYKGVYGLCVNILRDHGNNFGK